MRSQRLVVVLKIMSLCGQRQQQLMRSQVLPYIGPQPGVAQSRNQGGEIERLVGHVLKECRAAS